MSEPELPFPLPPGVVAAYAAAPKVSKEFYIRVWTVALYTYQFFAGALQKGNILGPWGFTQSIAQVLFDNLAAVATSVIGAEPLHPCSRDMGEHLFAKWMFQAFGDVSKMKFYEEEAQNFVRITPYQASGYPDQYPQ